MTIGIVDRSISYTTTGSSLGPFSIPFQFFEIEVYVDDVLIDPSRYVISWTSEEEGLTGSISFVSGDAPNGALVIAGVTSRTQQTDYAQNTAFPASSHEKALDRLTMLVQEAYGRSIRLPTTSDASPLLPVPDAGLYLSWDDDEGSIVNRAMLDPALAVSASAAEARAGISTTKWLSPSTAKSARLKFATARSFLEYVPETLHAGILAGTDVTDLQPYIADAFADTSWVHFPAGTYNTSTFSIPSYKKLSGEQGTLFKAAGALVGNAFCRLNAITDTEITGIQVYVNPGTYPNGIAFLTTDCGHLLVNNIYDPIAARMTFYGTGLNNCILDRIRSADASNLGILVGDGSNHVLVDRCEVTGAPSTHHIGIDGPTSTNITVTRCLVSGPSVNFGISFQGITRPRAIGNTCLDTIGEGIQMTDCSLGIVANNQVYWSGSNSNDFGMSYDNTLGGYAGHIITGNSISGSGGPGIGLAVSVTGCLVSGNHITNVNNYGPAISKGGITLYSSGCQGNTVQHNRIDDFSGNTLYGVHEWTDPGTGTPSNNVIRNNDVVGSAILANASLSATTIALSTTRFSDLAGSASVAQLGSTSYAVGNIGFTIRGVNFNSANTDNAIDITLPTGYTRYIVAAVRISHASHDLSTATAGLFTAAAAAGVAIVAGGSAITVSATADATNNNAQAMTVANSGTESYTAARLYFRVGTAEGAAATGDVTVFIVPIS